MIAEFDGNPKTTVIVVYAPTNEADEEEVEVFYRDLRNTLQDVPAHNFLAIIGDLNARLGPEDAPFTFHAETNRNGKYLSELLAEFGLVAANARESCGPSRIGQQTPSVNWITS